jgi:hypothetical protein
MPTGKDSSNFLKKDDPVDRVLSEVLKSVISKTELPIKVRRELLANINVQRTTDNSRHVKNKTLAKI